MKGLGIVVNVLAIFIAGSIGVMFRGKLKVRFQEIILQAVGLIVIAMGVRYAWTGLFVLDEKQLETEGTLLVLFALVVGTVFGEALRIDRGLSRIGGFLRKYADKDTTQSGAQNAKTSATDRKQAVRQARAAATGQALSEASMPRAERRKLSQFPTYDMPTESGNLFTDGFTLATLLCALNAMGLNGAISEGMTGDTKVLFIKAAIDAVIIFALATVYGVGATCAALPVLAVEGFATIMVIAKPELFTPTLINQLTLISAVMTLAAGICLCFGKRLRVINMLPAWLIPPIYELIVAAIKKVAE